MKVYTHSKYNYVTIAEIPLADIEKLDIAMCAQPKESLEKFYKRQERKPELLTNAGFFATSTGASVFTIVDEGKEYSVDPNNAYLDGGGSARMMVDGKTKVGTAWSRPVDSVVAVYLKQQILYRVQAGAFSKEANAVRLRDKIRAMNDTIGAGYAKAYVRQIDGIYKVQVGAFSKRENAERVQDDLTARGFSCYVTTV